MCYFATTQVRSCRVNIQDIDGISHTVTFERFPKEVEVSDISNPASVSVHTVASLPLADSFLQRTQSLIALRVGTPNPRVSGNHSPGYRNDLRRESTKPQPTR